MKSRTLKNVDWILILLICAITAFGIVTLYSAAGGDKAALGTVQKQLASAIFGLAIMAAAASIDDHTLPRLSGWIYWINVVVLGLVDILGHSSRGAQRWLIIGPVQIQPSEPAKIVVIITLSAFFLRYYDEIGEVRTVLKSLLHVGLPMLLIFKQPDLGSSLVIAAIWLGVAIAAGVNWKHLTCVAALALLTFTVAWNTGVIRDYQKQRLSSFLNPDADPRGSGYHIRQSKIAIGSGQVTGKGFRKGTQSQLKFIPEQKTDFIFTVVGEEFGFVGSTLILALYWLAINRIALIIQATEERLGRMIAAGVLVMLLFHVFVNIGMTLGIMPVTGVPLPLMSYGRSNLFATMTSIGLVLGVYARRHRITF